MLLSLDQASKIFADRMLFQGVSVKIEEGDRIGIAGENGAGKTTLLNLLNGDFEPSSGARAAAKGITIGFLRQNSGVDSNNSIYEEMQSVFQPLLDAQKRLDQLAGLMAKSDDHQSEIYLAQSAQYGVTLAYFEGNEGYQIDVKIKTILNGMGFADYPLDTVCKTLSGGEKTRLAFAKLLLAAPDLLMLDEPTNHLDFATLHWLEDYLQSYQGALVIVSHDQYFLDKLCTKMWDLACLSVTTYRGNYTKFIEVRNAIYERQLKEYKMQQMQVVKLTDFIARNKARASTAGMAKSREKELERIEQAERNDPVKSRPSRPHQVKIVFRYEEEPIKEVFHVEDLTLYAGDSEKVLLENISFDLLRGEKVAIVGANGIGKSSFLKTILAQTDLFNRKFRWGKNVRLSYFEQEQSGLHPMKTILSEVWDRFPETYERDIRNLLGMVNFLGEDADKRIEMLSGGEKARVKLAIMMNEFGNVLLLDEPTNHLDLATKEVLDQALIDYEGTILMISHDRYLLSRIPTKIAEMTPTGFVWYEGGYEAYLAAKQVAKETPIKPQDVVKPSNEYYRGKKERAEQVARKRRIYEIEQEISDLEYKIEEIRQGLSAPEVRSDYQKTTEIYSELERQDAAHTALLEEWADLSADTPTAPADLPADAQTDL